MNFKFWITAVAAVFLWAQTPMYGQVEQSSSVAKSSLQQKNVSGNQVPPQIICTPTGSVYISFEQAYLSKEFTLMYLNQWLGLNQNHTFESFLERTDRRGVTHISLKQYYKGIPVLDRVLILHGRDGLIQAINGQIAKFADFEPSANIDTIAGLAFAKASLGVSELAATFPIETGISVVKRADTILYKYVYKIRIESANPFVMNDVYVDAVSGEVLNAVTLIADGHVAGTGHTFYCGVKSINVDSYSGNYRLFDNNRNIHTRDASNAVGVSPPGGEWPGAEEVLSPTPDFKPFFSLKKVIIHSLTDTARWSNREDSVFRPDSLGGTYITADPYVRVRDGSGTQVYESGKPGNPPFPHTFTMDVSLAKNPPYTIEIWDYDWQGGNTSDSICAFTISLVDTGAFIWVDPLSNDTVTYVLAPRGNPLVDMHWGMQQTHDFYIQYLNRNGSDDNGRIVRQYFNPPSMQDNVNNANAVSQYNMLSYGRGVEATHYAWVELETVGHEFTHLVTGHNGNGGLNYEKESGALNESFSDIFGACVDFKMGEDPNWLIGEQVAKNGVPFRNMSNPKACGDPNTYQGQNWVNINSSIDNGGVHTNSNVQNYWFYLLSEGGSGKNDKNNQYTVPRIGIDTAMAIVYENLIYNLAPQSNYLDACIGSLTAAEVIYGSKKTPVYNAVALAWYAVGVIDNPVPFCDTLTTLITSSGTITDGSGAAKYSGNSDCIWVIQPPGATWVGITFTDVDLDLGNNDHIEVFSGVGTNGNKLFDIFGNWVPPFTKTPQGVGAMTIRFVTDLLDAGNGWSANYTSDGLGVVETFGDNISIYPNPASDKVAISGVENTNIQLYNILGELLWEQSSVKNEVEVNTADFVAGIYLLKVNKDQATAVKKIQIVR